jgi:hypothetical protein
MAQNVAVVSDRRSDILTPSLPQSEAHSSGVSWAAVIGGAFVAAALSLILLALGAGLGLSSVSPWSNVGASGSSVGIAAIAWLIIMQIVSSAMGGYLAGRLRTKWATIHSDEVYFRDTAHGFLVWAVGLVITASFLASAAVSMAGGTTPISGPTSATSGAEGRNTDPNAYFVDALFRSGRTVTDPSDAMTRAEAGRILSNGLRQNGIPQDDRSYLATLVTAKTGLSQSDSENRVSSVIDQAKAAADSARKSAAHLSIWIFIALLIGAFSASFAGTIGGRQRDHMRPI